MVVVQGEQAIRIDAPAGTDGAADGDLMASTWPRVRVAGTSPNELPSDGATEKVATLLTPIQSLAETSLQHSPAFEAKDTVPCAVPSFARLSVLEEESGAVYDSERSSSTTTSLDQRRLGHQPSEGGGHGANAGAGVSRRRP